uniref:Pyridoxine/pyridoxamine 5'-phosphate oxidase n=1 Tax=Acidicaldus sp. TaxID=1872105 RepID=A0A8J4HFP1_9PROT
MANEDSPNMTDPLHRFTAWLAEASAVEPNDPNAMTLATATPEGRPSARMVLLKGADARGFVFYTNLESRKSLELAANPVAALLFHWKSLRRQVRIEGAVEPVSAAEADAYFATRPALSRLGAWASDQSRPLPSRAVLEARLAAMKSRFGEENIPRPPHWSGWRLVPEVFEFWQDMPFRLHERLVFTRGPHGWEIGQIYP